MNADNPATPQARRARRFLLLLVALFAGPLVLAAVLVVSWRPEPGAQHGELLNPAQPLDSFQGQGDAGPVTLDSLRGHWWMVYPLADGACDARCEDALYYMHQIRVALGKDMDRVRNLALVAETAGAPSGLQSYEPLDLVRMAAGDVTGFGDAYPQPKPVGEAIYLVDPLGNLVLRYDVPVRSGDPQAGQGILKDLRRLLKYSKIG